MAIWFLFDLGNTLIKLAYERVLENICRDATATRDDVVRMLEAAGGYRDLERGAITFIEFYHFVCESVGYRGSITDFRRVWSDLLDGVMPGMEELIEEIRERYRVAFLSNTNKIHVDELTRRYASLFRRDDRFVYSYRVGLAKPAPEIFRRSVEILGALPHHIVFVDDMIENVLAARSAGMRAFQFIDAPTLRQQLAAEGLLSAAG